MPQKENVYVLFIWCGFGMALFGAFKGAGGRTWKRQHKKFKSKSITHEIRKNVKTCWNGRCFLYLPLYSLVITARPRDLKTTNNTSTDNPLYQDFRFKGYPSESFISPHNPQYKRNSAAEMNGTETSRYFGKTQHFDTGNYM